MNLRTTIFGMHVSMAKTHFYTKFQVSRSCRLNKEKTCHRFQLLANFTLFDLENNQKEVKSKILPEWHKVSYYLPTISILASKLKALWSYGDFWFFTKCPLVAKIWITGPQFLVCKLVWPRHIFIPNFRFLNWIMRKRATVFDFRPILRYLT